MAEQTPAQATLLGLPRELRLQILEEAIAIRRAAPASPPASQTRLKFRNLYDQFCSNSTDLYLEDADHAKSAQPSLLATSRQVREETQYLIGRAAGEPYQLDVMYVNGIGLMPSWVSLPCLSKRVRKLDIRIRFFDTPDTHSYNDDDDDSPPRPTWNIKVFLTVYLLRACWKPGAFDVDPRSPSEGKAVEPLAAEGYSDEWCAIDHIAITIESTDIPMKPHPQPRFPSNNYDIILGFDKPFGYSIFHRSDVWPRRRRFAPPPGKPNPRYGPEYHFAWEVLSTIRAMDFSITLSGPYNGLFLTNVGRVEMLVDDNVCDGLDVTRRFWELYKFSENTNGPGWDVNQAADKRKRLGMWTEVGAHVSSMLPTCYA
ncbi:uncharacterized protein B0H64DRAFT_385522 [Chaetomium fimeti]|uniref:F-box domain-containing protein n=1 Tax=Chaetomium fimeti TaxID=1854472 RepID=A0AAE0HL44_9PEZI|nr:hypothetical protein B0H64DRAFT_385522 [Chaetomium fimeti]